MQRYSEWDVVNISTVGIKAGTLMGAPHLADGSNSSILKPQTNWTQALMICASATRASIKKVKFMSNGTHLGNLQVIKVEGTIYQDEASLPLWAIERTNLTIRDYSPL
jgi:hypothetical protein